jgi:branched-chain amino acid aminotransferase
VRANHLASAYIRPMCFYGSEGMGLRADNLKAHIIVAAWEWGAYLGAENLERGIRIRTSSFSRHHVNITMCKAKANGNYMNSMLALVRSPARRLRRGVAAGYRGLRRRG